MATKAYEDMTEDEQEKFLDDIKKEPNEGSMRCWLEAINIFAKYFDEGLDETYWLAGEHDMVYVQLTMETLPPESEDGQRLIALGFIPTDADNWGMTL